ncbi:MAG: hypothetical protein K1X86_16840 [Ignavibacteria bacterium]|nr:hypothetical protein [Ignavibacteria bacterium]
MKRKKTAAIVDEMLNDLKTIIIVKNSKGFKKLLRQLTNILVNTFDTQSEKAIKEVITYLTDIGEGGYDGSIKKEVKRILKEKLGKNFSALVEDSFYDLNSKIYEQGIKEVGASVKLKLGFEVNDVEAAGLLGKQNFFWVKNHYTDKLSGEFDAILDGYFDGDKTIKEIADDFELRFQERVGSGRSYYEGLAEHTTNTLNEYGKIRGLKKSGLKFYEFVFINDDRQSEICGYLSGKLSGKKFSVADANDFIDKKILTVEDPRELKDITPFHTLDELKEFDFENLPEGFGVYLFHYRCRTKKVAHFD